LTALDGKRRFALAAAASHKEEVGRLRSTTVALTHCVISLPINLVVLKKTKHAGMLLGEPPTTHPSTRFKL